jgi:hypothetical protein
MSRIRPGICQFLLLRNINVKNSRYSKLSSIKFGTEAQGNLDQAKTQKEAKSSYELNQLSNVPMLVRPSVFEKVKELLGFQGGYKYPQPALTLASVRLYLCIQYQIDYEKFYRQCQMEDVMYSFCLITFLHVWMLSVALMHHGRSGAYVKKFLLSNMWKDIEIRAKKLKVSMTTKNKLKTYTHLNDTFRAFLLGFDEGLLSDDTRLAGAIWRHLLEMKELEDYAVIGVMCDYIRKNIQHLEKINEIDLLRNGVVSFVDLDEKELDHLKIRLKLIERMEKKESEA